MFLSIFGVLCWNRGVWDCRLLVKIVMGCSTNGFCTICQRNCSQHSRRCLKSSSYGVVVINSPKKGGGGFYTNGSMSYEHKSSSTRVSQSVCVCVCVYKCLCIYTCGIRNSHLLELSLLPWTWLNYSPKISSRTLFELSQRLPLGWRFNLGVGRNGTTSPHQE